MNIGPYRDFPIHHESRGPDSDGLELHGAHHGAHLQQFDATVLQYQVVNRRKAAGAFRDGSVSPKILIFTNR